MRFAGLLSLFVAGGVCFGQIPSAPDSDHDGLSDALEQSLLIQFTPAFQVGSGDCSNVPASFQPDTLKPFPMKEDSTLYGQVFRAKSSTVDHPKVEIHYYHLWARDCGGHGHPLDTEHVAALVEASGAVLATATWRATYWYAAAHEQTVCDVSQIARASTVQAETHGATVWISPGKHASYLRESICAGGCGADRCERMTPLHPAALINLGEPGHPMNGALFIASPAWPLAAKMSQSNFPAATLARLDRMPAGDIARYNDGRHPAQGIIAISSSTEGAIAHSASSTTGALDTAHDATGNALQKSYHHTVHALGTALHHVGSALGNTPNADTPNPEKSKADETPEATPKR